MVFRYCNTFFYFSPHIDLAHLWSKYENVANDDQTNIWLLATSERYWRFDPVNLYPTRYYNQCLEPRDKMGFPTSTSHQGRLQSHWWWCLWNRHWKHPYRAPTHGTTKSKSNSLSIWYLQSDMYFFFLGQRRSHFYRSSRTLYKWWNRVGTWFWRWKEQTYDGNKVACQNSKTNIW